MISRALYEIATDERVGPNYRQAKDIYTAKTLVESGLVLKLKQVIEQEFTGSGPELAVDLENLLHRMIMNLLGVSN